MFKRDILTIPNALSFSRIVFLPLLIALALMRKDTAFLIIFIVIGSTDAFDGLVARKFNMTSDFGKTIDSLADLFFYLACAWFMYQLFPAVLEPNLMLLYVFLSVLAISFVVSFIRIGKPVMMHTYWLKLNAVLVYMLIILSFFTDTTWFLAAILFSFIGAFTEEMAIFILFGDVDPDTPSIFTLMRSKTV